MFAAIAAKLGSFFIGKGFETLVDGYKAKLAAGNTTDRIAADLAGRELEVQKRERELQTQLLIVEQGHWATRWVRPVWSLPFILFTFKVVVWDKLLGWGVTDPLDEKMWGVFMIMVAAYFGGRSAEKVATTIAGAIKR